MVRVSLWDSRLSLHSSLEVPWVQSLFFWDFPLLRPPPPPHPSQKPGRPLLSASPRSYRRPRRSGQQRGAQRLAELRAERLQRGAAAADGRGDAHPGLPQMSHVLKTDSGR